MSSAKPIWFDNDDLVLRVYTQPKASRDQIVGLHGDEIKLAITAPPIDGKANAHLEKYLAKLCKVPKSRVRIEKGAQGRHKQIRIIDPTQYPNELAQLLP